MQVVCRSFGGQAVEGARRFPVLGHCLLSLGVVRAVAYECW